MDEFDIVECHKCGFPKDVTPVTYRGANPAKIVFVGEAPGRVENIKGLPFVHMSGSVLEEIINFLGLNEKDYAIMNTVCCYPRGKPKPACVKNCKPFRDYLLGMLNPKIIVTIGDTATRAVLGKAGISRLAGNKFEKDGQTIFPLIHPSFLLHRGVQKLEFGKEPTNEDQRKYRVNVEALKDMLDGVDKPEKDEQPGEPQGYVPLHCHDHFSIQDACVTTKDLVKSAWLKGFKTLALTNHATMSGTYQFYQECKKLGIKPIIGCEFYMVDDITKRKQNKSNHIVLLAKSNKGYKNLLKLCTEANTKGYFYRPRIDKKMLSNHASDLILLTGCMGSPLNKKGVNVKEWVEYLDTTFGGAWFIEVQTHNHPKQEKHNATMLKIAKTYNKPIVVTNDVHYANKEDASIQDIVVCIKRKKKLNNFVKNEFRDLYLMTEEEIRNMCEKYHPDIPVDKALANTVEIAKWCNVKLDKYDDVLPAITVPDEYNDTLEYFIDIVEGGFYELFADAPDEYRERLDEEMKIILDKQFHNYFLMVYDIIKHAESQGIMVGPGRGSVCGSLLAYCMGITKVDPLKYDILFFRFISPERIDWPDIDVDFQSNRRDEVIQYIIDKYGKECVCKIATFNTYQGKMAIKDVSRVYNVPYQISNRISGLMSDSKHTTIDKDFKTKKELIEFRKKYPEVIEYAIKITGLIRNRGVHAAGVIITNKPLENFLALERASRKGEYEFVSCFDKDDAEAQGLIKLDALGLSTLTVFSKALEFIKVERNEVVDLSKIPLDDKQVLHRFFTGDTVTVFQFEKWSMRNLVKRMGEAYRKTDKEPEFESIIAANALHRPGPLESGQTESYVLRMGGDEEVIIQHPAMEPLVKDTQGLIVYQEQIMTVAHEMAQMDWPTVGKLRKAVAKSKGRKAVQKYKTQFVDGSVENGCSRELATEIFEDIEKFGRYAFNKAHSTAYSMIPFWCAWLKEYYPIEYYTAVLCSVGKGKEEMIPTYIHDAREKGIDVMVPDINHSKMDYAIYDNNILCGFSKVKHLGAKAPFNIVKNQPYKSLPDFLRKVDKSIVNKRVIKSLIKAGAFNSLHDNSKALMDNIDTLADKKNRSKLMNTTIYGGMYGDDMLISDERYSDAELILNRMSVTPITPQDDSLNFFACVHPMPKEIFTKIKDFDEDKQYDRIIICGFASQIDKHKGKKAVRCSLHDDTGGSIVYIPTQYMDQIGEGTLLIAKGSSQIGQGTIYCNSVITLNEFIKESNGEKDYSEFFEYLVNNPLIKIPSLEMTIRDINEGKHDIVNFIGYLSDISYTEGNYGIIYFLTFEDITGVINTVAWANTMQEFEDEIQIGRIVEVKMQRGKNGKFAIDARRGDYVRRKRLESESEEVAEVSQECESVK